MWKGRCIRCGRMVDLPETPLRNLPPFCVCGNALRPHVVQFGEPIDHKVLSAAFSVSRQAELFLVVGTSGGGSDLSFHSHAVQLTVNYGSMRVPLPEELVCLHSESRFQCSLAL